MQTRGIIFDLYNTLVLKRDDSPFYPDVAADLGIGLDEFLLYYNACCYPAMRGELDGMAGRVVEACRLANHPVSTADVIAVVERNIPAFYDSVSAYPDTLETLERLNALGFRIAIASNASAYSEEIPKRTGMAKHVHAVIMSCRFGYLKPDRRIYEAACSQANITPDKTVFVGDGGDNELEGARNYGLATILIDRGLEHTSGARKHADIELKCLADVIRIVMN